jgi:hypothetical protein
MSDTKLENFKKAIREMYEGGAVLGLGLLELNSIVYPKLQRELERHLEGEMLGICHFSAISCVYIAAVNYTCDLEQQGLDPNQAVLWTLGEFNTTSRECFDFFRNKQS